MTRHEGGADRECNAFVVTLTGRRTNQRATFHSKEEGCSRCHDLHGAHELNLPPILHPTNILFTTTSLEGSHVLLDYTPVPSTRLRAVHGVAHAGSMSI